MRGARTSYICHTVTLHIAPIAATVSRSIRFPSGAAAQNSGAFWSTCRCSARSSAWTPKLGLIQLKPAITMRVTLKRARHSRQRSQIHRRPPRRGQKSAPPRSRCSPLTWRVRLGHLAHIQGFCFGVVVLACRSYVDFNPENGKQNPVIRLSCSAKASPRPPLLASVHSSCLPVRRAEATSRKSRCPFPPCPLCS